MQAKNVLYAAVGAPLVAARKVGDGVTALRDKLGEEKANYTKTAEKAIQEWAQEGEKLISRLGDGKVVEELSSKMDLDQAKEQVSRLRDQLEDILATWRTSFRPEQTDHAADAATTREDDQTPSSTAEKTKAAQTQKATTKGSATKTKSSPAKSSTGTGAQRSRGSTSGKNSGSTTGRSRKSGSGASGSSDSGRSDATGETS